jgi:hypothetical protein
MRNQFLNRSGLVLIGACGLAASVARATPPTFSITKLAQSGESIYNPVDASFLGNINNRFSGQTGRMGPGFLGAAVNSSGSWLLDADTPHLSFQTTHEALLPTQPNGGPYNPFIVQGFAGYMSAPTATATMRSVLGMSMDDAGDSALVMGWTPDDSCTGCTSTGVFFNSSRTVFLQGATLAVSGLAAGTTWDAFDSSTAVRLVSSGGTNRLLVVSRVNEGGVDRRIVLSSQLDATGNLLSSTLIAKEGGPVAAGLATWTSIAAGATAASMNASGTVVISGITSAGTQGVYSSASGGGFIAVVGGATPVAGMTWGSLAGSAVDIDAAGDATYYGLTASTSAVYHESSPDAGELMDHEDHTIGNGPLSLIVGTLSNDEDVDMYRIVVTDPSAFSATTVPDAGSGFPGAAFDTVLTLIADPGEHGAGSTPGGRTQCDNVSPSVLQSTITGANGATRAGGSYFLAISTPKSRVQKAFLHYATNTNALIDGWSSDPSGVAYSAGLVYWPDPSAGGGAIRRATTAGVIQPDLAAPVVSGIAGTLAIDAGAGKIYWADPNPGRISRSNLDGTVVEDVIPSAGVVSNNTFDTLYADACTGLFLDTVHGKIYWTESIRGEINVANLDGSNASRVRLDYAYPTAPASFPVSITPSGTFAPGSIAIDTSAGTSAKVFWADTLNHGIERCDLDGTNRASVVSGALAGASAIAIDNVGGKLYWTNTAAGKIQRSNLDGSNVTDVAISPTPIAITLDVAGGFVYWTSSIDRVVRRASIAGALPAPASTVVSVGADTGERAPDGPGAYSPYIGFLNGWTRFGAAGSTALPYQIKLTGATFEYPQSMLVKGNQKIALAGEPVSGVAGSVLTGIGTGGTPLRITDRGDVLWLGEYLAPSIYENFTFDAFLFNHDLLMSSLDVPPITNGAGASVVFYAGGARGLDVSRSGGYAVVPVNMSTAPFVQPDYALLFQFSYASASGACCNGTTCTVVAQASCTGAYKGDSSTCDFPGNPVTCCKANYNQVGGITVQDIFDFLNGWFAGNPAADFNGGGLSVQDIFDFLNAWFAGC